MRVVFISYRRDDTAGEARALYKDLVALLGEDSVFMDVDSIALGRDFREALQERLSSCDVMLVLIGSEWVDAGRAPGQRRLDDPNDFVRQEIAAALKRNIPVTPVLLQGAQMPSAGDLPEELESLSYRNGFELRHRRWESDVQEMVARLGLDADREPASRRAAPGGAKSKSRSWLAIGAILVVALSASFGAFQVYQSRVEGVRDLPEPAVNPGGAPAGRAEQVDTAARPGFVALLDRDVARARTAFDAAYRIWPEYQSIDEIRKLLRDRERVLSDRDSDAWPQLYKDMIPFQLPSDLRGEFKQGAAQ